MSKHKSRLKLSLLHFFKEKLKILEHLHRSEELLTPFEDIQNLYAAGILKEQSFLLLNQIKNNWASNEAVGSVLLRILFDELRDPLAYESFIIFCNSSRNISYRFCQFIPLGEQYLNYSYNDIYKHKKVVIKKM